MIRFILLFSILLAGCAAEEEIVEVEAEITRYALPNNSTFPIARAVEVPAEKTIIFHSGQVPAAANPDAERGSAEYYGDTYTQAESIFRKFETSFEELGVGYEDAVKMQVFMVGDPAMDGQMDFAGFMRSYSKYFGTEEQPNKPARSAFQIAGLAGGPNMLIEIEMVLVRP